jgi:hypothetical protein
MPEQKTAQQQAREQFKVAENTAQNALHAWNDMFFATTDLSFNLVERSLRYSQELLGQSERTFNEALASYRGLYQEGVKSWQGYVQGLNDIASRVL